MTKWRQGGGQPAALLISNASKSCHIKNVLFLTDGIFACPRMSLAKQNLKDFRIYFLVYDFIYLTFIGVYISTYKHLRISRIVLYNFKSIIINWPMPRISRSIHCSRTYDVKKKKILHQTS